MIGYPALHTIDEQTRESIGEVLWFCDHNCCYEYKTTYRPEDGTFWNPSVDFDYPNGTTCYTCGKPLVRTLAPIPASLIDNKAQVVQIQLPARWIARAFMDWLSEHDDDFADWLTAREGVILSPNWDGEREWRVMYERESE